MSGQLTVMGEVSVGACVPSIFAPIAAVTASLQAKLAGLIALKARLTITPPSIDGNIKAALALLANLRLMLTLRLPGVDFQLAAIVALVESINLQLGILLGFGTLAATAGVLAATYEGDTKSFGSTVTGALGPGILGGNGFDEMYAVILAARAGVSIGALKGVFIHA
jgi:hypothetical protein